MLLMFTYSDIGCISGFSRETLNAVIANVETREWRREFNLREGIPPEHPSASTTDDVECFLSVLRDSVGKNFTLKEVCTSRLYTFTFIKQGLIPIA